MKNEASKILIGYHANCIDGITAAWVTYKYLTEDVGIPQDSIFTMPLMYQDLTPLQLVAWQYDSIYIVDFSLPVTVLKKLETDAPRATITIIDHHKTALEMYSNEPEFKESSKTNTLYGALICLDMAECGASLAWKYFYGPDFIIPKLIEYVKDYDLWQFKFEETKLINRFLRLEPKSLPHWNALYNDFKSADKIVAAIGKGKAIDDYHNSLVADYVKKAEPCDISGAIGLVSNCSGHFASDVGHKLCEQSGTYGATWQQLPNGKIQWSLRSEGDYDVSAIAKQYGGGGHKNAAGFVLAAPKKDDAKEGITLWHT